MKNILRKIIILICVAVLFVMPVSTAYAASIPVLVINIPELGVKVYDFTPYAIEANDGISTALYDPSTSDQTIPVAAGKNFQIQINVNQNASLQVTIFGNTLYYNETLTTSSEAIFINLPANSYNENYHIWLNAPYNAVTIYNYTTTIQ
jgi:hypothetical protein